MSLSRYKRCPLPWLEEKAAAVRPVRKSLVLRLDIAAAVEGEADTSPSEAATLDWGRWHELLDQEPVRPLTEYERREYEVFQYVLQQQDAREQEALDRQAKVLERKSEAFRDSIRRLVTALQRPSP